MVLLFRESRLWETQARQISPAQLPNLGGPLEQNRCHKRQVTKDSDPTTTSQMALPRQCLRALNLQVCSRVEVGRACWSGAEVCRHRGRRARAAGSQAAEAGSLACSWGCWRTRGWVETITIEEEHTGALTTFLLPFLFLPPRPQGGGTLVPGGGLHPRRVAEGGLGLGRLQWVADAAGPSPALPYCLPLLPAPPPLHPPHPPPPGPRQRRLGEQPAAPGPLSLCLGPPSAPGPAQRK